MAHWPINCFMDVSKGSQKRVRIMIRVEEAGQARPEKLDNIGPNLTTSSTISLQQGQFRWKPVPRMSEEMVNVMSSFNMMHVSDTVAKDNKDSRENETDSVRRHSSRDLKEDIAYGQRRNSSLRGKNSLPTRDGAKHTLHKIGKATTPVHTPEMKAKMQHNGNDFHNEKKNEMEPPSSEECCSSKTQQLLARSSLLYGRIDNLRERAKLTRSASLQSSENKVISAIKEQVESFENDFEFTEIDTLEIKPSRSRIARSSNQRSLQKSMSDSHEEHKTNGVHNLRMPPILKSRSHTIL